MGLTTMTRMSRARWLASSTALLVVGFAALVAGLRNPPETQAARAAPAPSEVTHATGRATFERLGCSRCHSVGGQGNLAHPLDGVARRRDPQGLRDWALAQGSAADEFSAGTRRQKARAADDPDLPLLLQYLETLR